MERRKPASGVLISNTQPTIVFLTVCTAQRQPWLTNPIAKKILLQSWADADAWLIGHYLLMPDHLHCFCAPQKLEITLDRWITYWKSRFTANSPDPSWKWQAHKWDTRLRKSENYQEKWNYVRQNPVRKALIAHPDDWPHQGTLNELRG